MLTKCPYLECQHVFEVCDEHKVGIGRCVNCIRPMTYRSLSTLQSLETKRKWQMVPEAFSDSLAHGSEEPARLSVLLEDIRSLYNVGSIFRTADGAGFERLYLCGVTGCPPNKQIAKTSLGAEEHVSWEYSTGAMQILPKLKDKGVMVLALECTDSSRPLADLIDSGIVRTTLCLVLGNEVSGISAETLACSDFVCHLPMRGTKESLNVAVAYGIAAYLLAEVAV
ncbi:MAG: RNA methyltransferase [Candidatus Melainabacteria bacterium]|nr:RNA methyltransferase [Candidatus Melainabacteria bacterium]